MQGLELARRYYALCRPQLWESMPFVMENAAIGLAGEGSECFGLDDEISRDHDYGPAFCIWLPDDILESHRKIIQGVIGALPGEFMGYPTRLGQNFNRVGPLGIRSFYYFFTGLERLPENWREWMSIPEASLASAVNGEVFEDNMGQFTAWRNTLIGFYPKDVLLKKLAARAMIMGQAGQYNLPRSLKRGDFAAATLSYARFAEAALSLVFLLNEQYRPYYKLAARKARQLPVLGSEIFSLLNGGDQAGLFAGIEARIEQFCSLCAAELRAKGLSNVQDDWLWLHGPAIAGNIGCEEIRRRNLLQD